MRTGVVKQRQKKVVRLTRLPHARAPRLVTGRVKVMEAVLRIIVRQMPNVVTEKFAPMAYVALRRE